MMQIQQFKTHSGFHTLNGVQTLTTTGATDWLLMSSYIAVQLSGPATSVTFVVERSVTDPNGPTGAMPVNADDAPIQGNPSTGLAPVCFLEPSSAWWRVRVTAITGAQVTVAISGTEGGDIIE